MTRIKTSSPSILMSRRNALRLGAASFAATGLMPAAGLSAFAQEMMLEGDKVMTGSGEITVHPVSHATVVLSGNGKTIYVDPVGEAAMYEAMPKPDLVLVTHEHGDHYSADVLAALVGDNTALVTNPAVYDMLPADLKDKATSLANGESDTAADISIEAIPAYNMTEDRLQYHPEGRDNGYILDLEGGRVYIAGDTEDIPEMRALSDITLAFVPMNLPYTMTEDQAADGVLAFAPKVVYPYHYRGSDIEKFKSLVDEGAKDIEVRFGEWY